MGRDSDLYELLLFLKKQDVRALLKLKEYINATISRTNEKEQTLFNHLVKLNISDLRKFNTEKACYLLNLKTKQVYPVQQKLLKHIEQFLIHEEVQKDTNLQRNVLLKVYKKYDMKKMFNATIKRKLVVESTDYLYKKYEAHLIQCDWLAKQNRDKQLPLLKTVSAYFQHYYDAESLRLSCMKLVRDPASALSKANQSTLTLVPYKEDVYTHQFPITYIYYLIYELTIHRTEIPNKQTLQNYAFLENCLFGLSTDFPYKKQLKHQCRIDIFSTLQNFCVFQINHAKDASIRQKYLTTFSKLITQGQEQGLLKEMRSDTFITALVIWIKLKEYDTARKFLDNRKSKFLLLEKYRECTPQLAEALYYHYISEEETKKSLKMKHISKSYYYLNKIIGTEEMNDIRHRCYIDLIWVKMDIHTKDFRDTLARLDRFYSFLNEKEIKIYNLTIRYMKRFVVFAHALQEAYPIQNIENAMAEFQTFKEDVEQEANFPLKDWMLEKVVHPFAYDQYYNPKI